MAAALAMLPRGLSGPVVTGCRRIIMSWRPFSCRVCGSVDFAPRLYFSRWHRQATRQPKAKADRVNQSKSFAGAQYALPLSPVGHENQSCRHRPSFSTIRGHRRPPPSTPAPLLNLRLRSTFAIKTALQKINNWTNVSPIPSYQ